MVLGLTGPNAAGKGEVASYLQARGFKLHSLSDIVREEAARSGFAPERQHLIRTGNLLRRESGPGVLARRILSRLGERDVVDSIRNPAEVAVLRELPSFVLVGVTASREIRFGRSVARQRPGDPQTLSEFVEREHQENSADPEGQQLDASLRLADHLVLNDGDLDALHAAVDELLSKLEPTA